MTRPLGESEFEETTIERLKRLGYEYLHAQDLFQRGERERLQEVVLPNRLESFLMKKYPFIPALILSAWHHYFFYQKG